jgi:hypothetical protein
MSTAYNLPKWIHSGKVKHLSSKIYNLKMQLHIKCVNEDKNMKIMLKFT